MYALYTSINSGQLYIKKVNGYDQKTMKQLAPIGQKQYEKFVKT